MENLGPRVSALRAFARTDGLTLRVTGNCMDPSLRHGSKVQVHGRHWPWPGDMVAFTRSDGRVGIHRLMGYWMWGGRMAFVTMADDASDPDPVVPAERMLGPVSDVRTPRPHVPHRVRLRTLLRWYGIIGNSFARCVTRVLSEPRALLFMVTRHARLASGWSGAGETDLRLHDSRR